LEKAYQKQNRNLHVNITTSTVLQYGQVWLWWIILYSFKWWRLQRTCYW